MKTNQRDGFTVVEVSLTLAIAGLIFLMVLVALPALQRSQRDTARREKMSDLISQIKKYQSSSRGTLPSGTGSFTVYDGTATETGSNDPMKEWKEFYNKYLGTDFVDADGSYYNFSVINCATNIRGDISAGSDCINAELDANDASYLLDSANHNLVIVRQSTCEGDKAVGTSNPRNLSVLLRLEGAGVYCINT